MSNEIEIAEIGVEGGVDLGLGFEDCFFVSPFGVIRRSSSTVQCCGSGRQHWQILHGAFAKENQV
jgi:hypothetical protein